MKTRIHQIVKKSTFRFKLFHLVSIIFICYTSALAQSTQVYENGIEVKEGVNIESNLPTSLNIQINGTVTTNNTKDSYNIEGKNGDVRLNILKDLEIETWDKNIIQQKTVVTVKAVSKDIEADFLKSLNLSLKEKADGRVIIDANLDIEKFKMDNGFFKADDCKIKLKNGKTFEIEYLELSTFLTIPANSNLFIKGSNFGTVRLGELNGNLDLDIKYVEVYVQSVKNLRGSLRWCYNVSFDKVDFADLSSSNSYIYVKKLEGANIGMQALNDACDLPHVKHKASHSAQTKYRFDSVGLIQVNKSNNDEIIADEVEMLKVKKTKYTDFKIKKLNDAMLVDASNADIDIDEIGNKFTSIDIKNELSSIDLGFEEGASYTIQIKRNNYFEFDPDKSMLSLKDTKEDKEFFQKGESENGGKILIDCDRCKLDIK